MHDAESDDKLLKAAAALGNDDVLVMDTEELTTAWDGDILRKLLEFEVEKTNSYLTESAGVNEIDNRKMRELGRAFLQEKLKVLQSCLSKLKD